MAPSERDLGERVPGLVRVRDATLGQRAAYEVNRALWKLLQFWKRPPEAGRVRYFYIGQSVDAAIKDDGSYELRDKRGLMLGIASTSSLDQPRLGPSSHTAEDSFTSAEASPARPSGVAVGFREPESLLRGKRAPNAEVRKFLETTRPLREHLMSRQALRAQSAANARMDEVLQTIWQAPVPAERKRRETFALWDECSEDETGALARRRIEAFVHELAVRRSACPYSAADLAELNASRRSEAPFAPCVGTEASGRAPDGPSRIAKPQMSLDAGADAG